MSIQYRIALPVFFGSLSVGPFIWPLFDPDVMKSMGRAYDTVPLRWPNEEAAIVLSAINLPAVVMTSPFFALPNLDAGTMQPVLLVAVVAWWWWAGCCIDFGLLRGWRYRRLLCFAGAAGFSWHGRASIGEVLPHGTGWCILLGAGAITAGLRKPSQAGPPKASFGIAYAVVALSAVVASLIGSL